MLEKNIRSSAENRNAVHEAQRLLEEMFERGVRPIVTVPFEYEDNLRKGLRAHSTWIPGLDVIAGMMGKEPYLPAKENRIVVKVNAPIESIHPRLTGPDRSFNGVVTITGPISPDNIEIIDRKVA